MPRIVDKKEKARAIGQAALRVFGRLGYPRARMADIAEEAGVGKGTLYEYFRDKADILRFVFAGYFEAFKDGAAAAMAPEVSPGRRLLALVDFALQHMLEWQDHCAVYVDYFGAARVDHEKLFSLQQIYDEMGGVLQTLIEEAKRSGEISPEFDAVVMSEMLLSLFDGLVLHDVFAARKSSVQAVQEAARMVLVHGLVKISSPRSAGQIAREQA